jgi:hypothetical protein
MMAEICLNISLCIALGLKKVYTSITKLQKHESEGLLNSQPPGEPILHHIMSSSPILH